MSEENGTESENRPAPPLSSFDPLSFEGRVFSSFCRNDRGDRTKFAGRTANPSRSAETFPRSTNDPVETVRRRTDRQHVVDRRLFRFVVVERERKSDRRRFVFSSAIKKRFEKASAGNRSEFEEHFAFLVEPEEQIGEIGANGYQTAETSFNVLGN